MSFLPLPEENQKSYRRAQGILYLVACILFFVLLLHSIFPTITHRFDFKNPESNKNTLPIPHNSLGEKISSGKIPENETLLFRDGTSGDYEKAHFEIRKNKNSSFSTLTITVRRGFAATWLPFNETPVTTFPEETLYRVEDTFYALRNETLIPFISREAFLSRYKESSATVTDKSLLDQYELSEIFLGFRPGMLVAYADGVFVIEDEAVMRPIGSARIFLNLGFRFEDVKQVNAEELGIYERGPIFLSGDMHPNGTLFQDSDTEKYFLTEDNTFREILPGDYLTFLLEQTSPIRFSKKTNDQTVSCMPEVNILKTSQACSVSLVAFQNIAGSDYELRIDNTATTTTLRSFEVRYVTARNKENFTFLITQLKENFFNRFGIPLP